MSTPAKPVATAPAPPTTSTTPLGFNKHRRDIARGCLGTAAALLVSDSHGILACLLGAASILALKEGTSLSHKNIKWMILSAITFCAGLMTAILQQGYQRVDEDKAYELKMKLWLRCKLYKIFWGVTLGFFVIASVVTNKKQEAAAALEQSKTGGPTKKLE